MGNQKTIRVLIAEDDYLVSKSTEVLLERMGYTVVGQATNGLEAIEMTRSLRPDVVLMDLKMPVMDGIEATQRIHETCPTPVVALTAHEMSELVERATAAGTGAYLVKPADPQEIGRAISITIARFDDMMELRRLNAELQAEITDRKQAEEEIRQRNRELAALNAAATMMIQSALDLGEVLQQVADGMVEGLGCNTSVILLLDEKEGVFKGGAVSTRAKIIERINSIIGFPLFQIEFPARRDFNETVRNALDGWMTIKHDLYELIGPTFSRPVCSALQRLLGSKTFLGLPLLARGKVVGGVFASMAQEELSEGDIETMMTFANQAAIAIENARLYEETQQRALEQETLREAALALTTALDRNQVIGRILAQLQQVVPYDSASVQLLREDRMEIVGGRGFPNLPDLLGISFPADGDNPNSEVIRTRAPFIVEDASAVYEAFRKDPHWQTAIRSWLGVPMLIGEQLVGMIALDKREAGFYTPQHARLAEAFAAQAAVAVENARLFEEEKRRATQLALINEVGEKAASILDLDGLMQEVTRSIQESFNYYNVALFLLDEGRHEVVMQAVAGGFEHIVPGDYRQSLDEGIVGFVARTGNFWLASDTSQDPHYVRGFLGEVRTKSELCVPIRLGNEVIGALDVQSIHLDAFDREDVAAMEVVADRLAIGIQNAHLYEEMAGLYDVGLAVTSALELDKTLRVIYEQVNRLMSLDTFYIALYDEARGELRFEIFVEEGEWLPKFTKKLDEGALTAWIVQSRKPLFIGDLEKESPPVVPGQVGKPETQSWMGFPLLARDKVVGVISVQSFRPHAFTEEDKRILSSFANQAAVAIENARLYEQVTRHVEALSTLHEISQELTSTLDLDQVLHTIAEDTIKLTGAARSLFLLVDPEAHEMVLATGHGYSRKHLEGFTFEEFEASISGWVRRERKPALVTDTKTDARQTGTALRHAKQFESRSLAVAPLWIKGEVVGTLTAVGTADTPVFTDETLELVVMLANQAIIAIENARLFEEVEEQRLYLAGVLRDAPDAIVTLDDRFQIVEWNAGAERLFGYSQEEAVGQNIDHLVAKPDVIEEAVRLTQTVMGGREVPSTEAVRYRKDGSPVDVILAGSPILVGDELIGAVAVYTDITARVRMEETLLALALVDELTGLYNRRGFLTLAGQQLKTANRAKRRLLLLFADLDGLKQINDAFGHPEGDQALIEVADVLKETFRESDIIARFAGDEFVVLAIETDGLPAKVLTTRLQENLEARNAREGRRYKLSLSMGIARYDPEHPCSLDDLLTRADRAMYKQKGNSTPG